MRVWVRKETQPIYERAHWTGDRELRRTREAKWRKKSWYDEDAKDFALSKARFEPEHEDLWECGVLLGKGAFGMVGLWHKYGKHAEVLDSVAIKQTEAPIWEVDRHGQATVPWEVIIMNGLEERGCRNVTDLRKVTFFKNERPQLWRLYMEVCKIGTFSSLIKYYKRHHPGKRIPEAFLWQLLRDFAKTAEHMSKVRFPEATGVGNHPYVLHLDLKDENVLLANPPDASRGMNYPTLKVGDWGMAEYTSMSSKDNSARWMERGTYRWMPPEQRKTGKYGRKWRKDVFGPSNYPFTMAHVIWQMGACIYGLMKLDLHNESLDNMVIDMEHQEARLRDWGYSLLGRRGTFRSSVYSKELCTLVEECLLVDPKLRPSISSFLEKSDRGWRPLYDRFLRAGNKNPENLHAPRDEDLEG